MPTIYKTVTSEDIDSRDINSLTPAQESQVNTILNSFITYFKNKHL